MSTPARSPLQLSPHFRLREFASGDDAPFPAAVIANLRRVAAMLERVRAVLDTPLIITHNGGYRTPAQNRRSGGVPRSYHLRGLAADVVTREVPPEHVQEVALQLQTEGVVGGVGCYPGFTHLDLGPVRVWASPAGRLRQGAIGQKNR